MRTEPRLAIARLQAATIEIRVLGTLEVIAPGGSTVAIRGPKLRTLVAALALRAGQVMSADRLIDAVYGEDLPKQAGNALQALISALRRALRASGISYAVDQQRRDRVPARGRSRLRRRLRFVDLLPAARVSMRDGDLVEASQLLHTAIDSWRGHALEALRDCDEVYGERVRLEELRLNAIEDCIECDLAVDQDDRWLDDMEQIVRDHPLRERLWGQLMVLQYRAGRQADALRSFQRARHHLADELGITPGPELRRIESAILAHDPTLLGPVRTEVGAQAATPAPLVRTDARAGRPHRPGRCRSRQMPMPDRGCARPRRLRPPDAGVAASRP